MGLFDKIFGKENPSNPASSPAASNTVPNTAYHSPQPNIQFGHYVDSNKNPQQLAKWTDAVNFHNQKNYRESFVAFLDYVGDPAVKNVTWKYVGNEVHFTLEQGSKIITGIHNGEYITAEAPLAEFEQPPIPVMRQLLTSNYLLRYNKFAIKDNKFGIYFKAQAREASPTKLYHAFKELALKADKNDDYLTEEFTGITRTGTEHIPQRDEHIAEIKYKYWTQWVDETMRFINGLDKNSFSGIIAYSLLNLCYKSDYLLSPQGHFMDELTRIQHIYWNKADYRSTTEKTDDMIRNIKQLMGKPKEYFTQSFYNVKATFGLISASANQTIVDYISDCLKNTDWYIQNRHPNMEMIIYEYTNSYCLFNFGMYPAHYRLMNLHMQILNENYFRELGFATPYTINGVLQPNAIIAEINRIINEEKKTFPNLAYLTSNLKFDNVYAFHYGFLSEIRFLNFVK